MLIIVVQRVAVGAWKTEAMLTISRSRRSITSHLFIVPCQNMDPGVVCEFQINTRSPPPLHSFFFRRGPQKLSGGSHKDGWGSAACSTFLTVGRRWGFHWQVSAPLQANTSGTGRIAPWRRVCSKVLIVTLPPCFLLLLLLLLCVRPGSFRRERYG